MNPATEMILALYERLANMTARAEAAEGSAARLMQINGHLSELCQMYEKRPKVVRCTDAKKCFHACLHKNPHVEHEGCDSSGCYSGYSECKCEVVEC